MEKSREVPYPILWIEKGKDTRVKKNSSNANAQKPYTYFLLSHSSTIAQSTFLPLNAEVHFPFSQGHAR